MPVIQVGRASRSVRSAKTAVAGESKVSVNSTVNMFLFLLNSYIHKPFRHRAFLCFSCSCSAQGERREGLHQGLLHFLFQLLCGPAPPRNESVGADDHSPGSGDSIRITELVAGTDEISCVAADLIAVQREIEGFFCAASSLLPMQSLWANEQDEVGAEQVQRRDRLALSLEPEMRGVGPRFSCPLIWRLHQGKFLLTCFPHEGSRVVAIARIEHDDIHRDPD